MTITNRDAYEGKFNNFVMPVTKHDEIATEALSKLFTIQEHLENTGDEIAALALESLSQSIVHLTNASMARNRKTYIYLAQLFDDADVSVPKNLAKFEAIVNSDTEVHVAWQ